jgi:hypothetical protein
MAMQLPVYGTLPSLSASTPKQPMAMQLPVYGALPSLSANTPKQPMAMQLPAYGARFWTEMWTGDWGHE